MATGHECQWNGPSWPFATSITLTALANVLNGVPYHGRNLSIFYDKTGERYGKGRGLRILADGKEIGSRENLGILKIR